MSMTVSGMGSAGATQAMSGASMRKPPAQKMADLFASIDTSGSGSITKAQFEQAFQTQNPPKGFQQAGADAVWAKLDPNGTGSVSKQDFVTGMTAQMAQMRQGHHHHHAAGSSSSTQTPAQTVSSSLDALNSLGTTGANVNTTA